MASTTASPHLIWLRTILHVGDRIYIIPRYLNPSGTMGVYSVYRHAFTAIADPMTMLDGAVADVLGLKRASKYNGIVVRSSGENRMWRITYELGRKLWPEGFACLGERRCLSNEHRNGLHQWGEDIHHADGGYALTYREL